MQKSFYIFSLLALFPLTRGNGQTFQNFSNVVGPLTFFYGNWELTGQPGTLLPNSQFVQNVGSYDFTGTGVTD